MGKVAIILVIGFSLALGLMGRSITKRLTDSVENSSSYTIATGVKNITTSAVEIYVRMMKAGTVSTGTFTKSLMGGTATVTISKVDYASASKPDTFQLTSIGVLQKVKDTVVVLLTGNMAVPTMPINGALTISAGAKLGLKSTTADTITGFNHDLNGTPSGSCPTVHGLVYGQLGGLDPGDPLNAKVNGVGSFIPDTFRNDSQPDYLPLVQQLIPLAGSTINGGTYSGVQTFGTVSSPQITVVTGSAKFNDGFNGAGILIFAPGTDGKVNVDGAWNFKGLVFLVGGAGSKMEVKFNGAGTLLGGMVMAGEQGKFNSSSAAGSGGINFRYSCEAIGLAYGLPTLAGNYIIGKWWE